MLGVLLLATVLRLHGLVWTLPYHFHPDEMRILQNGISILQTGEQGNSALFDDGGNYPPLRAWEVSILRRGAVVLFGDQGITTNSLVVLFGRLVSLLYALLTCIFLFHLGRAITRDDAVGILAALLFAVWPTTVMFGQRILADGAGLMFFTLTAWLSVRAYQTQSPTRVGLAFGAAVLAGLGKYNYFTALLIPGLMTALLIFRWSPRRTLAALALGAALIAPAVFLGWQTQELRAQQLYYEYLDDRSMLEGELRRLFGQGYTHDDLTVAAVYWRYPITQDVRLLTNFQVLDDALPPYTLPLALLGVALAFTLRPRTLDQISLWVWLLAGIAPIVAFSLFRVVEGRQMFAVGVTLLFFAALGVVYLGRFSRPAAWVLGALLVVPLAHTAWAQNIDFTRPDSRVATVNWFLNNAREGTGIAIERVPEEFMEAHGYASERQFNAQRIFSAMEREPIEWENTGFYYVVADTSSAGGYGFFAEEWDAGQRDDWLSSAEVVARFEEGYSGPDRIIMRVFRPQHDVDVAFGQVARLHGYDINRTRLAPGDTLRLKYFWQARQPDANDYTIFNHVLHVPSGEVIQVQDRLAGHSGTHPSSNWQPYEWLFDHFEIVIPPDAPAGEYQLLVGLYRAEDGDRLPVPGYPDNALPLADLTVVQAAAR